MTKQYKLPAKNRHCILYIICKLSRAMLNAQC